MHEQTATGPAKLRALLLAMDDLAGDSKLSGSSEWGDSGLGSAAVELSDFMDLARLNHRVSAQLGRWIVQGAVTAPQPNAAARSGPLVDYGSESPPAQGSPTDTFGLPAASAASAVPDASAVPAAATVDVAAASDFCGKGLPFGAQVTLESCAWGNGQARTLVVAARFAARFPELNRLWSSGDISADMIREIARVCRSLTTDQVDAFVAIMVDHLPGLNCQQVRRLAVRVLDLVRPDDLEKGEDRAHEKRSLTFSHYMDTVIFHGRLPKLEGQLFADAITAMAEKQRSEGDGLSAGQRQADALTELIAQAASNGFVPTLGGLPVGVTLTMNTTVAETVGRAACAGSGFGVAGSLGDGLQGGDPSPEHSRDRATYPDGALVASGVARFALCAGQITPIKVDDRPEQSPTGPRTGRSLAARLLESHPIPLSVGRAQRLATSAQRKALALRDGGCVIPGCSISPNRTQPHHVLDFSLGGPTDLDNLASLCWTHHRQVDLGHWTLTRNSGLPTEPDQNQPPYWAARPVFVRGTVRRQWARPTVPRSKTV